eukprot:scaffold65725_cov63-Attheya_sp.AAC.3
MAVCIDRAKLSHEGEDYFVHNEALAIDLLTVLDGIRLRAQGEFKMNVHCNVIHNDVTPDHEEDEDDNALDNIDSEIIPNIPGVSLHNTAILMLAATAKTKYKHLRVTICEELKCDLSCVPSFYKLTLSRPAMEEVLIHEEEIVPSNVFDKILAMWLGLDESALTSLEIQRLNLEEFALMDGSSAITRAAMTTSEITDESAELC